MPVWVMVIVGVPVISIILWIPVVVVAIVVVPVIRTPWAPPVWVIIPVPGRMPSNIRWQVHESDQRPCGHFIGCYTVHDNCLTVHNRCCTNISRIGGFIYVGSIIWLNNIVLTVHSFITDQLDPHLVIGFALHNKYSDVLVFTGINGHLKYDYMQIPFRFVDDPDVIDPVIPVEVKIIYPGILIIQVLFKTLQGL